MYYLLEKNSEGNFAGYKARVDVNSVLSARYGQSMFCFTRKPVSNFITKFGYVFSIETVKLFLRIPQVKKETMVFQYPMYNKMIRYFYKKVSQRAKTILFVHDIDALRSCGNKSVDFEVNVINQSEYCIVHNDYMRKKLVELGVTTQMVALGLFDYLLCELPKSRACLGKQIVFAGNLNKSNFLLCQEIDKLGLLFNLYGPNNNQLSNSVLKYKGSFPPDQVPFLLEGSFGLIWDGDSLYSCTGDFGEYTKYNNPHKLSLYLASGMPVIVWKESAIADFVIQNKIGFAVNSLTEVSDYIDQLDEQKYEEMVDNAKKQQIRVTSGYYTNKALDDVEALFTNN